MNLADRLLYRENHSRFSRFVMLLRLYAPALRFKLLALTVLSFLLTTGTGLYIKITGNQNPLGGYYLLQFIILLAPITLARRDFRDISSQLPVTAGEKFSTLLFLYWLVFPGCICLAELAGGWCVSEVLHVDITYLTAIFEYPNLSPSVIYFCGSLQSASIVIVELYALVKARKSRILSGIGAALLTFVSYILISAFCAFGIGLYAGFQASYEGEFDENMMAQLTLSLFPWVFYVLIAVAVVVLAIFMKKLYKSLNNSGF